jgi:hypothetical protein
MDALKTVLQMKTLIALAPALGRLRDYRWRRPRWARLSGAEAPARSTAGGSRCPR